MYKQLFKYRTIYADFLSFHEKIIHICLILKHNRACYVVLPSVMNISLEIGTICSARQRVP